MQSLDTRFKLNVVVDIQSRTRNELFSHKGWDPNITWDLVMCIANNESLLLDDEDVKLCTMKGMLLHRDRHYLAHMSNGAAWKGQLATHFNS